MKFSLHGISQFVRWHRRGIGLLALCVAVIAGLGAALTPPAAPVALVVAARALSPGAALAAGDLTVIMVSDVEVPEGGFSDPAQVVGRPLVIGVTMG
ncbi:MAG: SAF domain-containing protein, partial [Propionibacteriaceae bacterium]|nr:SAF domain-containing protein [Propionibacteriaceae bacterium]